MLFCFTAYAQTETLNWYMDGQTYATTTCESGNDILLPTTPTEKTGYTFIGWGEYIPIEYIETTGTQYINTNFLLNKYMRFEYDISLTTKMSDIDIGGGYFGIRFKNYFKVYINKHEYMPCNTIIDREKHTLTLDAYNDIASVDNCSVSMNGDMEDYSGTFVIYIATWNIGTGGQVWSRHPARHYGLRFYERDVLVRDFVPALDKNGTPCMYEKIQKKFYYNAGTGDLIAGPIIDE